MDAERHVCCLGHLADQCSSVSAASSQLHIPILWKGKPNSDSLINQMMQCLVKLFKQYIHYVNKVNKKVTLKFISQYLTKLSIIIN